MSEFSLQILGCSSATPTKNRFPSAQYLVFNGQHILIDCGEGTQVQMLKYGCRMLKVNTILISHLHGDHYFGLIGLLSTMSLQGRKTDLTIICPSPLKEIIDLQVSHSGNELSFKVDYIYHEGEGVKEVLDLGKLKVSIFPIKHRIPCWGFLIEENNILYPLNLEACELNKIPTSFYNRIKNGADYESLDGNVIPNAELVFPKRKGKSFGYVSDTMFDANIAKCLEGVDLLYHEATFLDELKGRALETYHSTAKEAGEIAKMANVQQLIIGHYSARYKDETELVNEAMTVFENTVGAVEGMVIKL